MGSDICKQAPSQVQRAPPIMNNTQPQPIYPVAMVLGRPPLIYQMLDLAPPDYSLPLLSESVHESPSKLHAPNAIELPGFSFKYGSEHDFIDEAQCCICHETYAEDNILQMLPCNHIFDRACLLEWYKKSQTCPICRLGEVIEKNIGVKNGMSV